VGEGVELGEGYRAEVSRAWTAQARAETDTWERFQVVGAKRSQE